MRGEEDLMYGHEAWQTVTITSPQATVFGLQREPYRYMITKASMKKRAMQLEQLIEQPQVADSLKPVQFAQGERMISFGDEH
eukprot:gene48193-17820_t